jgi:hypothetical protein
MCILAIEPTSVHHYPCSRTSCLLSQQAYQHCTNSVPTSVPTVYQQCTNKRTNSVPTSVPTVYQQAYQQCTNSVPTVYQQAYQQCTDSVPTSVPTVYQQAYQHCTNKRANSVPPPACASEYAMCVSLGDWAGGWVGMCAGAPPPLR